MGISIVKSESAMAASLTPVISFPMIIARGKSSFVNSKTERLLEVISSAATLKLPRLSAKAGTGGWSGGGRKDSFFNRLKMFMRHRSRSAERSFIYLLARRMRRVADGIDRFQMRAIRRPKDRADIIEAANIFENRNNGQAIRACGCGLFGKAMLLDFGVSIFGVAHVFSFAIKH